MPDMQSPFKEKRLAAGLTLGDVAFALRNRLGRAAPTEATLSRWENGSNQGYQSNLAAVIVMADLYGSTVAELDPGSVEAAGVVREMLVTGAVTVRQHAHAAA
jgi:transcriptional regulator with XRE-family HTH domain